VARLIRIGAAWFIVLALGAAAYITARDYIRSHPQDVPWTALRLTDPVGAFTLRKLGALAEEPAQCRSLLLEARAADVPAPSRRPSPECGYDNGIRLAAAAGEAAMSPAGVIVSCPVAAAMLLFERQVLQPAAERHFGSPITAIHHAGSYNCRRIYGRSEGAFSEHAAANALDITGFALGDGTRVSVLADWNSLGPKGAFLREVKDGACRLFATTLSPDYNEAHRDHLHFDQASRRTSGFGLCR
jgi:hypothetical protein